MNMILPNGEDVALVALDEMNQVHEEELVLIQNLLEEIKAENIAEVDRLFSHWLEHTEQHFDNEACLMEKYNFPPMEVHVGEHQSALANIYSMQEKWKDTRDLGMLQSYIVDDWTNWFINHVNSMDFVTARFIASQL